MLMPLCLHSQTGTIFGSVKDSASKESLPGVNILVDTISGGITNAKGNYRIALNAGYHKLVYKYIGYSEEVIFINIAEGEDIQKDILLAPLSVELNTAVITASRYQQRLSDVSVSMEVIPAKFIKSVNTYYIDQAISLVPGVDIIDGQANIRGGSGYTYGAGSRVMVMMDGLPILAGGVNDVKWNSLPVEIIKNVEIIKGASSALYGSSALNGVINLITAAPGIKPETNVELSAGMYLQPERKELSWFWDRNPLMGNAKFSHLRKIGQIDFVLSGNVVYDESYRQDNELKDVRVSGGLRYNPKKVRGLSAGFNTSFQAQSFTDFLIWKDADSGAYMQNPDAITPMHGIRFNADPYIHYYDRSDGRHSLKTRYYRVSNEFDEDPDKDNSSDVYFGEYQYQKKFGKNLHLSTGFALSYTEGKTNLYGNHYGSTQALYAQLDHKFFDRLSVSFGLRWERYTLDNTDDESRPVFRTGINYKAAGLTFIRASYGQGYRYPSMAEKYTSTDLGGLKIFPNEDLEPETGWSAELGIKQGFAFTNCDVYFDIAAFWTEYDNMIDFIFGVYNPPGEIPTIEHLGFKSLNTGKARINGVDLSANLKAGLGPVLLSITGGYTYMNPLDLSEDSAGNNKDDEQILKYRYRHSAKGDLLLGYTVFDLGLTAVYRSFIERIDPAFEEAILGQYFFPGLKEYRQENDRGAVIFNLRVGWQISPASKISFHINNMFNKEYMGRPGDIHAPRNINLQYLLTIH
jgi:iron complex outermembrane receptor protein